MPLIIITGKPCTGKTTFAKQLVEHLLKTNTESNVALVNEESLLIKKKEGYKNSFAEKETRGALKGATNHKLNADCYVVVDSLNYIKGYRYELYCSARTFRTPHCVIWVGCNDSVSSQWNTARLESGGDGFDEKIMEDLRMRYEAPNESNRWDFPLFKVTLCSDQETQSNSNNMDNTDILTKNLSNMKVGDSVDIVSSTSTPDTAPTTSIQPASSFKSSWKPKKKVLTNAIPGDEEASVFTCTATVNTSITTQSQKAISFSGTMVNQEDNKISGFMNPEDVLGKITDYFSGAVAPVPNSSTISTQRANADLLYELDRTSQQIIQAIITHQSEGLAEGTPLKFVEYDRALTLNRHTGLAELQRHRRQYVKINGRHPPASSKAIGTSFIDFLALHI